MAKLEKEEQELPKRQSGAWHGLDLEQGPHRIAEGSARGVHPLSNPRLEHSPQVRVGPPSGGKRLTPRAGRRAGVQRQLLVRRTKVVDAGRGRGLEHAHTGRDIDRT